MRLKKLWDITAKRNSARAALGHVVLPLSPHAAPTAPRRHLARAAAAAANHVAARKGAASISRGPAADMPSEEVVFTASRDAISRTTALDMLSVDVIPVVPLPPAAPVTPVAAAVTQRVDVVKNQAAPRDTVTTKKKEINIYYHFICVNSKLLVRAAAGRA